MIQGGKESVPMNMLMRIEEQIEETGDAEVPLLLDQIQFSRKS
jgi:hypothetical protein